MNAGCRIFMFGLLVLASAGGPIAAWAAPFGYSVNSDQSPGDRLHRIDLATGAATELGVVQSLGETRTDVEGLALDPDGMLWAADDDRLLLFPVNTGNGQVDFQNEVPLSGLGAPGGNDFGMTFTCSGELYLTSIADQSLYRVALDGTATLVGSLGANISGIASRGNPAELYGIDNDQSGEGLAGGNRSLYRIDPQTGATTLIGEIGPAADDYFQAGLSFDAEGNLWAITDRTTAAADIGSQILRLDISTGAATLVSTTTPTGFESLAVAPPGGCPTVNPPPPPTGPSAVPDAYEGIPTLDAWGRIAAVLGLFLLGLYTLHRRP